MEKFLEFYPGLRELKKERIPFEARRGYFIGLDGRKVICDSEHLMLAGHLQNGESVVMKHANNIWRGELDVAGFKYRQVNDVHDEFVTLSYEDLETSNIIGKIQCNAIEDTGKKLGVFCPLAGDYKIGDSWWDVH